MASKKKPSYRIHKNGFIMSKDFSPEAFEEALNYNPDPSDIFICTYPKCGTTWMQNILYLLLNQGKPLEVGQNINDFVPHIEEVGEGVVRSLPTPRLIKTHLPFNLLPKRKDAKYIVVMRNPKDCCVSFFYHTKGFVKHYDFADGTFDDFFDLFIRGKVDYCDYFDHVLSYLPRKNDKNMLFLLYEEMKMDAKGSIKKIARFLGGPFLQAAENPSALERVLRFSDFKAMKSTPSAWSSQQAEDSPGFIRKGEVGDWRRHFSEKQTKLMDERFKVKFGGTEAEHFWDEFDC